jgi:hypothetical protein
LMLGIQPIIDKLRGHENETLNRWVLQKFAGAFMCLGWRKACFSLKYLIGLEMSHRM